MACQEFLMLRTIIRVSHFSWCELYRGNHLLVQRATRPTPRFLSLSLYIVQWIKRIIFNAYCITSLRENLLIVKTRTYIKALTHQLCSTEPNRIQEELNIHTQTYIPSLTKCTLKDTFNQQKLIWYWIGYWTWWWALFNSWLYFWSAWHTVQRHYTVQKTVVTL